MGTSSTKSSTKPSKHFFRSLFSSSSNSIQPSTSSSSGASNTARFYDGYTDPAAQKYSYYGYIPPKGSKEAASEEPSSNSTSTTSSLRRSFAKFKSFKSSRSKSKETKDDGAFNKRKKNIFFYSFVRKKNYLFLFILQFRPKRLKRGSKRFAGNKPISLRHRCIDWQRIEMQHNLQPHKCLEIIIAAA